MSKIFLEILDKERQNLFDRLSFLKKNGYLAGGTALALQIKHRKSEDFDIFTPKPISTHLKLKVKKMFGYPEFYVNTSDQISFKTKEGISITFVWYYFKTLTKLISTSSLSLASIKDIAADKAHTIGRRAVWRDYVDIFILLERKYLDLGEIINLAEKKFEGEFVKTQFLEQLPYFADIKVSPIEYIKESYDAHVIQSFLKEKVDEYLDKVLK